MEFAKLTCGCLLLNESTAESTCIYMHNKLCFIWSLNTGLTVLSFLDRKVWANSAESDLEEPSDQGLHCLHLGLHLLVALTLW